jgi:hypothetical protein
MKKRIAIAAISITALFASSNVAVADAQSDYQVALQLYKTALANWNQSNKADQNSYKEALKAWNEAKKVADETRKAIADKFKSDAEAIKARTAAAILSATNAKDKKAATAVGKNEMDAAILARNSALVAMPVIPVEPTKPTPAPSPTPPTKPAQSVKPKPTDQTGTKPSKSPKI